VFGMVNAELVIALNEGGAIARRSYLLKISTHQVPNKFQIQNLIPNCYSTTKFTSPLLPLRLAFEISDWNLFGNWFVEIRHHHQVHSWKFPIHKFQIPNAAPCWLGTQA